MTMIPCDAADPGGTVLPAAAVARARDGAGVQLVQHAVQQTARGRRW
jgi:hypothetical protein